MPEDMARDVVAVDTGAVGGSQVVYGREAAVPLDFGMASGNALVE